MNLDFARPRSLAIAIWSIAAVLCTVVVYRTTFVSDLSAFLPQSPTQEQRVLLDQLRDGVVSRLILVGIEGSDAMTRAALSKETGGRLRDDPAFASVANGEAVNTDRDLTFLFENRYLLSPAIDDAHFTVDGLHAAIEDTVNTLASPAGLLIKRLLPRDPTGETLRLLEQLGGGSRPNTQLGVWTSHDGSRALLLAQTRAAGVDIDGQQHAMRQIEEAFAAAKQSQDIRDPAIKLGMAGPGVFSVRSRDTIKDEVSRLAILSTLIIVSFLLLVYRSVTALVLGLFPVVSGALVGVAAVSLFFGNVHGLTLGFGTTLIGESIDYSIYLFVQSRRAGDADASGNWVARFWPTIRLGVLTSVVGFSTLLLSSFPGLAQLGLFTIAGLLTAAAVTRFVLPQLLPEGFVIRDVTAVGKRLAALSRQAEKLRWPVILLVMMAVAALVGYRTTMWNAELAVLSPVPAADQARDASLRADLGAPDSRYMIVISDVDQESALQSAERIAAQLQALVGEGLLAGFETPSRYLPSVATQQARQASLQVDEQRLTQAVEGLPVQAKLFAPFLVDVAAAKARPRLQRSDLANTSFALAIDSLLMKRGSRWTAILPLATSAKTGSTIEVPVAAVRRALAAAGQSNALFVDLKAESDSLYGGYLHEAVWLSMGGLIGIIALLLVVLRSPLLVARVVLPLLGSVILVAAVLVVCGHSLTILHLVGLLLIVAVGSNYALFFNPRSTEPGTKPEEGISPRTLVSLVFANLTTVAGFGLLGISQVPVLQAIGVTVGPGAVLALLLSAIFARGASREAA